jgi:AMP deaminase
MDLDYILGIISDGPAKSFAYRRLRYLESKWNLYVLLNEYQELADSKVWLVSLCECLSNL